MSSAVSSRHESSSRTWWPLSSKGSHPFSRKDISRSFPSEKQPSRKTSTRQSTGLKFSALASAMGFKSKKHPSLTIQEPPLSIRTDIPSPPVIDSSNRPQTTPYDDRPSSKSTFSQGGSPELRTPSDDQRDTTTSRQSLLTLFDIDPFAARVIALPQTPSDSALPPYSSSSVSEYITSKSESAIFKRTSYASSFHSNHDGEHSSLCSVKSPKSVSESNQVRKLTLRKSTGSFRRKPSLLSAEGSAWENPICSGSTIPKSGSLSTLTDKGRSSQPARICPFTRAKGMSDTGTSHPSKDLQDEPLSRTPPPSNETPSSRHSPTSPASPRTVMKHQASLSRIGLPPSAPPAHDLPPPPPISEALGDDDSDILVPDPGSASSSSLSFASSVSSNRRALADESRSLRPREKNLPDRSPLPSNKTESGLDVETTHTSSKASEIPTKFSCPIKKRLSNQSLGKRGPASAPIVHTPHVAEKVPRKQRSFHHPRIPIPPLPIPLRQTSSFSPPSFTTSMSLDSIQLIEQRRGSASGPSTSGKKRLFSGPSLRRPSTSQCTMSEDDTRSVSSMSPEHDGAVGPLFSKALSSTTSSLRSSFWEEVSNDHTSSSPTPTTQEYTPQQIMSPAEMLKVEASVQESDSRIRTRGLSLASVSTTASDIDGILRAGLSPSSSVRPVTDHGRSRTLPLRSNSLITMDFSDPPRSSVRPSTSQANMTLPTSPARPSLLGPSSPQPMIGLPPPPRPRPQLPTTPVDKSNSRLNTVPFIPLSPPPVQRNLRMKLSRDIIQRQSIMRKPSFLDIDDEMDKDVDVLDQPLNDSFLDLARESFDTVRSG